MGEQFVLLAKEEETEESTWKPIENDTILRAKLIEMKTVTKNFKDDKTGLPVERVQLNFEVTDPDSEFDGRRVMGETSTNFVAHSKCKLYTWVQAMMGQQLPEGFVVNTDHLMGSEVNILVSKTTKPRADGQGDWVNNAVKSVMPLDAGPVNAYNEYNDEPF
jgi:hypothetical protein